jgi:regulator of telomere elongation helicase 1
MVSVVQCGLGENPSGFHFTYERRRDHRQTVALGELIKRLEPSIPGGILLFFPSYDMMQHVLGIWEEQLISFDRELFREAKQASEFKLVFERYSRRVARGKRAMLVCVCRGKLSEGIDFADDAARAIFIAGVPYPCVNDPRVVQKQEYLDLKVREEPNLELNGEKWYKLQASRTVNQAIGRVIRHIKDYGAIYLCD